MNDIDPQAWLADVLARIAEHPVHRLDELLPWNWRDETAPSIQSSTESGGCYAILTGGLRHVQQAPLGPG